jgi:ABC-type amino acid transport substrate-binding protein
LWEKKIQFLLLLLLTLTGFCPATNVAGQTESTVLVIGVNENRPLAFYDENGEPAGFYVDLINYVADQEDWVLEYVNYPRPQTLKKADSGEIDIIASIEYSDSFSERFVFTGEKNLDNWGVVLFKMFVVGHGGRITVNSDNVPGMGSSFTAWLPIMDKPQNGMIRP